MSKREKFAAHKHIWIDRYTRDWRYMCSVCGSKSRNDFCQEPEFREPFRIRSTVMVGPDAGRVVISEGDKVIYDSSERSGGDGA